MNNQEVFENLARALHLTSKRMQRLSMRQVSSLADLAFKTPIELNSVVKNNNIQDIYDSLTYCNGVEIQFQEFLNALKKIKIVFTSVLEKKLCLALSRLPETQIVNISIFTSLVKYIVRMHTSSASPALDNACSLDIDATRGNVTSSFSCFSSIMRDAPQKNLRKTLNSGIAHSNSCNSMSAVMSHELTTAAAITDSVAREVQSISLLPWESGHIKDDINISNKLRLRIKCLTSDKLEFLSKKLCMITSANMTRSYLSTCLLDVTIYLNPTDAEEVWQQFKYHCINSQYSGYAFAEWMNIPTIVTTTADANPNHMKSDMAAPVPIVTTQVDDDCEPSLADEDVPTVSKHINNASDDIGATSLPNVNGVEAAAVTVVEGNAVEEEVNNRLHYIVKQMQSMRTEFAVVFRRINGCGRLNDNAIKCSEFATALTQAPISMKITDSEAWCIVCDMANLSHTSKSTDSYILYADIITYLDNYIVDKAMQVNYKKSHIIGSLKRKLQSSRDVAGDRIKLYAFTKLLRQRIRNSISSGGSNRREMSSSWDSDRLDYCSSSDLMKLLCIIDVHLTPEESNLLCTYCSSSSDHQSAAELGVKLSSVIVFLGDLL